MYMILVHLLLVNMLIAMMGHTYEVVQESHKEWHRQVWWPTAYTDNILNNTSLHQYDMLLSHYIISDRN